MRMGSFMKRIALALALIVGFSTVAAPPAQAGTATIRINNNTNRSVWITLYASCGWTCSWNIIGGGVGAFCLPAHASRYFDHWKRSPMAEVKFRAEVKLRTDCGGPTISDTYDTRKSSNDNPDDTVGNVVEVGNDKSFYMKIVGN